MLAHFASTSYLQSLYDLVVALQEGRHSPLPRQRQSNGAGGLAWRRYDWTFLAEIKAWTEQNLLLRRQGIYRQSNASSRMLNAHMTVREYMGADEVEAFDAVASLVGCVSDRLDSTIPPSNHCGWNDRSMSDEYERQAPFGRFERSFAPNSAFGCATGAAVPRTGIYMDVDDANATLQFAWAGKDAPCMRKASTFNELGVEALNVLGRDRLWRDQAAMRDFIHRPHIARQLEDDGWWPYRDSPSAPALLLGSHAFKTVPATWVLVEASEAQS